MKLLRARFNAVNANKVLKNSVIYSSGFFKGIKINKSKFDHKLASYTIDMLYKYIDAQARIDPASLHHVYEWNSVGSSNARLYEFEQEVFDSMITISGRFLNSNKPAPNGDEPFRNKAEIMENGISVTISPKNSSVLAFEQDGETIFTVNSIFVEHPGGDEVAGSFGKIIEEFFDSYFTSAILQPILTDLESPDEFSRMFSQGLKGNASIVGINAGKRYIDFNEMSDT